MTTELTTPADPPFATPAGRFGERSTHEVGPYAQPSVPQARHAVDAVLIDAIRATIGPFVPAPWRTGAGESVAAPLVGEVPMAVTNTPTVELPWIDTFLDDSTESAAMESAATEAVVAEAVVAEAVAAEAVAMDAVAMDAVAVEAVAVEAVAVEAVAVEAAVEAVAVEAVAADAVLEDAVALEAMGAEAPDEEAEGTLVVEARADDTTVDAEMATAESIAEAFAADESSVSAEQVAPPDAWPMDEAGAAMKALAGEMPNPPQRSITPLYVPPVASTPPLPMWGDDDLMDIMPVRAPAASEVQDEHWAASARREAERAGNPEAAARALEDLARRVRSGELELPGYAPEMGDAAALAAALAALLGVRR